MDLQRGEVEWRGGNLYFDKWDYDVQGTCQQSSKTSALAIDNWPGGRMNNRILKSAMYIAMGMSLAAALPATVAHAASDGSLVGRLDRRQQQAAG